MICTTGNSIDISGGRDPLEESIEEQTAEMNWGGRRHKRISVIIFFLHENMSLCREFVPLQELPLEAIGRKMLNSDKFKARIYADLGLDRPHIKGQTISVRNCWHFYTAGESVDALFYDSDDFRNGMNRIFSTTLKFNVLILAFVLMDTHVHFILYGGFDECKAFMHEYIRRTSSYLTSKYSVQKKLQSLEMSHQPIDDYRYLLTAICYTIKNPPCGGLRYNAWDYPWSSGALYFRSKDSWTSPIWMSGTEEVLESETSKRKIIRTRALMDKRAIPIIDGIVFPGEYVAVNIVEKLFGSHRSFNYFMCITKEADIEERGGIITHLSIPIQEMRSYRDALCSELFGDKGLRNLDTAKRIKLARALKRHLANFLQRVVSGKTSSRHASHTIA